MNTIVPNLQKICPKCGESKEISLFSKDKSTKTGLSVWCKMCRDVVRKRWYENNKEKQHECYKNWVQKNPERHKEIGRNGYHRNREKHISNYHKKKKEGGALYNALRCERSIRKRVKEYNCEIINLEDVKAFYIWVKTTSYMECGYCKNEIKNSGERQIDHIVPIFMQGRHAVSNLTPCCKDCNQSKNRRSVQDFLSGTYAPKKNYPKKKKVK